MISFGVVDYTVFASPEKDGLPLETWSLRTITIFEKHAKNPRIGKSHEKHGQSVPPNMKTIEPSGFYPRKYCRDKVIKKMSKNI